MFGSFLGDAKSYLSKAFILTAWLPVLIFASATVTVCLVGNRSLAQSWQSWSTLTFSGQGVLAVGFLMAVTLLAFILYYVLEPLTLFFEGYWEDIPILSLIEKHMRQSQRKQLEKLNQRILRTVEVPSGQQQPTCEQTIEYSRLTWLQALAFPPEGYEEHIRPTRLGNICKVAQLYPYLRYGIDTTVVWPRLRSVLPKDFVERIQDAQIATNFLLLCGLLSLLFSLVTLPYLLLQRAEILLLILSILGIPLGVGAYYCSLAPATNYAELIKVAFDLYRHTLLKALDIEPPPTLVEERGLWDALSKFISFNMDEGQTIHFTLTKHK